MKLKIRFVLIVFIIVAGIYMITTTNSRYISEINSNTDLDVAIPRIELEYGSSTTAERIFPGDSQSFEFYVRNYEESKINEVLMSYYIKVNINESGIPLTYKIYEISGNIETELTQSTQGFGPITLNYGKEEEKYYKIIFIWDQTNNNVQYADKQYSFNIEINAIQTI